MLFFFCSSDFMTELDSVCSCHWKYYEKLHTWRMTRGGGLFGRISFQSIALVEFYWSL